jgi:hypothetical protein
MRQKVKDFLGLLIVIVAFTLLCYLVYQGIVYGKIPIVDLSVLIAVIVLTTIYIYIIELLDKKNKEV